MSVSREQQPAGQARRSCLGGPEVRSGCGVLVGMIAYRREGERSSDVHQSEELEGVQTDASADVLPGSVSTAPASALVRLGNTTVLCGITLEIAPPDIATPNEGFLGSFPCSRGPKQELTPPTLRAVPNIDLPPLCSPLFRPGAPSDEAQVLSTRLRDILLSCVRTKHLAPACLS